MSKNPNILSISNFKQINQSCVYCVKNIKTEQESMSVLAVVNSIYLKVWTLKSTVEVANQINA